jgi:NADPH2 dehydrogenase
LKITDAIHAKRSYIFVQLFAMGRAATQEVLETEGNLPYVAPSSIPLSDRPSSDQYPQALTLIEIDKYVGLFVQAAKNAIEAGFDGVEVHCANGFLIDQFLQDTSNARTDEYGGSVENRSRFGLRIVDEVVKAVGEEKTGVRLSPWNRFQGE